MRIKDLKVCELKNALGLETVTEEAADRVVCCGYAGDLLSWVMGRAPEGCVWVTVMSNVNVIAVASLADVGCVLLAEGAELDAAALEKAREQKINVYRSPLPVFDLCAALASL